MNNNRNSIHTWSRAQSAFISAFLSLLSEMPFESIRTAEIIKRSTYSRSAFYTSFRDKYDLAEQVFRNEVRLFVKIIYDSIDSLQTANTNVEIFLPYLEWFEHVYKNRELYACIIHRKAPDWNSTAFTLLAVEFYRDLFDVKYVGDSGGVSAELMNFAATKQDFAYVEYWELTGFKYSADYMARQATIISRGGLVDAVSVRDRFA